TGAGRGAPPCSAPPLRSRGPSVASAPMARCAAALTWHCGLAAGPLPGGCRRRLPAPERVDGVADPVDPDAVDDAGMEHVAARHRQVELVHVGVGVEAGLPARLDVAEEAVLPEHGREAGGAVELAVGLHADQLELLPGEPVPADLPDDVADLLVDPGQVLQ